MIVLGLTGSFGSGKSAVAETLAREGARVIDADALARAALEPGTPGHRQAVEAFGEAILAPGGRIDRAALGRIVFADPRQRRRLEAIVHPAVRAEERRLLAQASPGEVVVLNAPLLFETGLDRECDRTCVVVVGEQVRAERLAARGVTEEEVRRRLCAQMPQEEKARRADYIIDNSGALDVTRGQARRLMMELKSLADAARPPKEQASCPNTDRKNR